MLCIGLWYPNSHQRQRIWYSLCRTVRMLDFECQINAKQNFPKCKSCRVKKQKVKWVLLMSFKIIYTCDVTPSGYRYSYWKEVYIAVNTILMVKCSLHLWKLNKRYPTTFYIRIITSAVNRLTRYSLSCIQIIVTVLVLNTL